jgi:hypothetical protein
MAGLTANVAYQVVLSSGASPINQTIQLNGNYSACSLQLPADQDCTLSFGVATGSCCTKIEISFLTP